VSGGGDSNLRNNASSDVVVVANAVIQAIPTMNEWSLVLLAVLLGGWGSFACRARRPPQSHNDRGHDGRPRRR
jgi:hypothetical protein